LGERQRRYLLPWNIPKRSDWFSSYGFFSLNCTLENGQPAWRDSLEFDVFPSDRLLQFRFSVVPFLNSIDPATDLDVIGRAKVSRDGKSIDLDPAHPLRLGLASLEFKPDVVSGRFLYKVMANRPPLGTTLANVTLAVSVRAGATTTSTEPLSKNSSTSGGGESSQSGFWRGKLSPGDEILLGVVTPPPPIPVEFTIENPAYKAP
jgi:hypothetical protein